MEEDMTTNNITAMEANAYGISIDPNSVSLSDVITTTTHSITTGGNSGNITIQGSGTTYPSYTYFPTMDDRASISGNEEMKELLEDIKEEYQKASDYMDKLVTSMKEDKENLAIYNANFQYYVGMKMAYEKIISKLEKVIDEENS